MADTITGSVGQGGLNRPDDVKLVQSLLARHAAWLAPDPAPAPTGQADAATIAAITKFQRDAGALLPPDGRVDPGGFTLRRLGLATIPRPAHPVFAEPVAAHAAGPPSAHDYAKAAQALGCEVAAIQAVSEVETGVRGCWDEQGRPTILFERHKFAAHTRGEFNPSHPDISNATAGGYGRYSEQFPKLRRAAVLNERAALMSASWGGYQILGENYAQAGYASVEAFVSAQMEGEQRQLTTFVTFVKASPTLLKALAGHDWITFASIYNGPGYKDNEYDTKMADAYKRLAPPPPPPTPGAPAPVPGKRR